MPLPKKIKEGNNDKNRTKPPRPKRGAKSEEEVKSRKKKRINPSIYELDNNTQTHSQSNEVNSTEAKKIIDEINSTEAKKIIDEINNELNSIPPLSYAYNKEKERTNPSIDANAKSDNKTQKQKVKSDNKTRTPKVKSDNKTRTLKVKSDNKTQTPKVKLDNKTQTPKVKSYTKQQTSKVKSYNEPQKSTVKSYNEQQTPKVKSDKEELQQVYIKMKGLLDERNKALGKRDFSSIDQINEELKKLEEYAEAIKEQQAKVQEKNNKPEEKAPEKKTESASNTQTPQESSIEEMKNRSAEIVAEIKGIVNDVNKDGKYNPEIAKQVKKLSEERAKLEEKISKAELKNNTQTPKEEQDSEIKYPSKIEEMKFDSNLMGKEIARLGRILKKEFQENLAKQKKEEEARLLNGPYKGIVNQINKLINENADEDKINELKNYLNGRMNIQMKQFELDKTREMRESMKADPNSTYNRILYFEKQKEELDRKLAEAEGRNTPTSKTKTDNKTQASNQKAASNPPTPKAKTDNKTQASNQKSASNSQTSRTEETQENGSTALEKVSFWNKVKGTFSRISKGAIGALMTAGLALGALVGFNKNSSQEVNTPKVEEQANTKGDKSGKEANQMAKAMEGKEVNETAKAIEEKGVNETAKAMEKNKKPEELNKVVELPPDIIYHVNSNGDEPSGVVGKNVTNGEAYKAKITGVAIKANGEKWLHYEGIDGTDKVAPNSPLGWRLDDGSIQAIQVNMAEGKENAEGKGKTEGKENTQEQTNVRNDEENER